MTEWSKHVHRFAKKHNMTYKQANVSRKCKEAYKKRKPSPRRRMNVIPTITVEEDDDDPKTKKTYERGKRKNIDKNMKP